MRSNACEVRSVASIDGAIDLVEFECLRRKCRFQRRAQFGIEGRLGHRFESRRSFTSGGLDGHGVPLSVRTSCVVIDVGPLPFGRRAFV
ncbi:MAG: hypothetical protein ABSB70_19320 [Candidatus Velthaea sp.]